MPGKMARSDPRPSVRITRGAGSGQHLASVLQEGRESANIDADLGFIWRISAKTKSSQLRDLGSICYLVGRRSLALWGRSPRRRPTKIAANDAILALGVERHPRRD